MVSLVVVQDKESNECLYRDGERVSICYETTVYAIDITDAAIGAGSLLLAMKNTPIVVDKWPAKLSELSLIS